ncbi:MAG: A/G-specific adenine glycosylase [Pseudomonadota bacterium]|nr:A/G-specific adenine glycosylase [Pseudomonadota bacterium]
MKRVVGTDGCAPFVQSYPNGATPVDPFASSVIDWQRQHGRHALPWQNTQDAYRIWLSEIMLQQTQVAAVIPYYQKFLQQFPDVAALAAAPVEQVMSHWSGLGYYTRARNLHACAMQVVAQFDGRFPDDPQLLAQLPGIGRSTAAAITAFAYGTRAAIMDGNVKRVFCRVFGIDGVPSTRAVELDLWQRAERLMPVDAIGAYTQGLMDLGATVCKRSKPECTRCPLAERCVALATDRVELLPQRKPKKALPQRATTMLVIVEGSDILLQQRPDNGIWGGLLSLPELHTLAQVRAMTINNRVVSDWIGTAVAPFGEVGTIAALTPFAHGFTHFRLDIEPYLVTLSRRLPIVAEADHVWLPAAHVAEAPLPAPVKKLLLGLFGTDDLFRLHDGSSKVATAP